MTVVPEPFDFPPMDYTAWIEKVKAELKGKSISEFDYTWDGVRISPFEIPVLPPGMDSSRKSNSWKVGSYIDSQSPSSNDLLLKALNEGAASIDLRIMGATDWSALFKKVNLEWIHLNLRFEQAGIVKSFIQYITERGQQAQGSIRIINTDAGETYREFNPLIKGFRLLNYEVTHQDNRHSLATIFHQITQDLEFYSKKLDPMEMLSHVALHISGQNDLLLNTSLVRAIRLLWRQLMNSAGLETGYPEVYIIAHIPDDPSQNQYIRSGLVAISLILGGIDELFIESPDRNNNLGRYGRMIQHIFVQEAGLDKVADPLSGSRVVEYLTQLMVQRVWNESMRLDQIKK